MNSDQKVTVLILSSIVVTGIVGIPIGNPKFIVNAIILESVFASLIAISVWRMKYSLIPCMAISTVVIVANSLSPRHVEIMSTFQPLANAIVLIIGGYILQILLLGFSLKAFKSKKYLISEQK